MLSIKVCILLEYNEENKDIYYILYNKTVGVAIFDSFSWHICYSADRQCHTLSSSNQVKSYRKPLAFGSDSTKYSFADLLL